MNPPPATSPAGRGIHDRREQQQPGRNSRRRGNLLPPFRKADRKKAHTHLTGDTAAGEVEEQEQKPPSIIDVEDADADTSLVILDINGLKQQY